MGGLLATIVALLAALGGLVLYLKQERLEQLEQLLDSRRRELEERRRGLKEATKDLERRERAVAAREGEEDVVAAGPLAAKMPVEQTPTEAAGTPRNGADAPVSLLFVAGTEYRLLEIEPRALTAESALDLEGQTYVVARVGQSPLPADHRRCAYVDPERERLPGRDESS